MSPMIKPEVIDALVAAGCTAEQLAAAIKADQAMSSGAERQARFRARRKALQSDERNVTGVTVTDAVSPKKETSPTPPKEKTTPSISPSVLRAQFEQLWAVFPNKVGKRDAEKAFVPALKRSSFETILAGAERYAAKTDDRPWCNPATFLNQDRWADQPAALVPRQSTAPPSKQTHNDILDAIIRGDTNVSPVSNTTIDASYERSDGGSAAGAVRLYAVSSRS